ncbi:MAG: hypothetical protein NTY77_09105 [Elusimicrobia bacterium]|nr:hypothetical protein [Elusimicrobiota bacterium]
MSVIPRIRNIEFLSAPPENRDSGGAEVRVNLEDGSASAFGVLTPSHVGHRMNEAGQDFSYGTPALFVKRLDQEGLAKAAQAMASDMSGFWLRYYNSRRDEKKKAKGRKK